MKTRRHYLLSQGDGTSATVDASNTTEAVNFNPAPTEQEAALLAGVGISLSPVVEVSLRKLLPLREKSMEGLVPMRSYVTHIHSDGSSYNDLY